MRGREERYGRKSVMRYEGEMEGAGGREVRYGRKRGEVREEER